MRIVLPALGLLLLFSSCDLFDREEVFVDATVAEAVSGSVESETKTFRITNYEILAPGSDHLLLKSGNTIQIVAATGYQDSVAAFGQEPDALLVKAWTNPYPYFRLVGYEVAGARREGSFVIAASELPILMDRTLYDTSFFQNYDLEAWETEMPEDVLGRMIGFVASVERLAPDSVQSAAAPAASTPPAGAASTDTAGKDARLPAKPLPRYFLTDGKVRLSIENVGEPGVRLLLDGMIAEGKQGTFYGSLGQVNRPNVRRDTGIYGVFTLNVFDFANKLCVLR